MHYKKLLVISLFLSLYLLFVNFTYVKVAGAHPGTTGAPGDFTCSQMGCHSGPVIQNDTLVNSLIFPTADSTYVPGTTYLVKVKVKNPGIARFGFEIVAIEDKTETNTGTFALTEPLRTQIITHSVNTDVRYEVTHIKDGTPATPAPGFNEWSFNWTAPSTDIGTITFYYATNNTNNDGASTGDEIRLSTFRLKPSSSIGINELFNDAETVAAYISDGNFIDLKYALKKAESIGITVTNVSGQQIYSMKGEQRNAGANTAKIQLPTAVPSGMYFVNLECKSTRLTKKVLVR
jgi:hypothetical protein